MEQIVIGICGISSVYLSQDLRKSRRKYACILGLLAQPFWLYTAVSHEQWGIAVLSFVYAFGWARGFRNYWLRKEQGDV